ncbi:MAG: glycosyltransferase family 2 protein, partial [Patescibacteria group bacterium]
MRQGKPTISTIITTKNRAALLNKCLGSLHGQLAAGDEIVIINNNSTDQTAAIIKKHQKYLPLRAYHSRLKGYPRLYNLAISKAKNPLLVFVDDDCVVGKNFVTAMRQAHRQHPQAVIQGKTLSLPRGNIYAEISAAHVCNWVQNNTIGRNRLRTIDNKNLVIPKKIMDKFGGFSVEMALGAEDTELGWRVFKAGIPTIYNPSIIVYHHERTSLLGFLKQRFRIAVSHAIFDQRVKKGDQIKMFNRYTFRSHWRTLL